MLKLTNSFCRSLRVTCEGVNLKVNVRKFAQLTSKRKRCADAGCAPSFHVQQWRHAGTRRGRIKIPPFDCTDPSDSNSMSEHRPTPSHCTHGGKFEVSADGECKGDEWRKNEAEGSKDRTTVPSNFRLWEPVSNATGAIDGNSLRFRVVSYNVLAQYLLECHPYLYTECSPRDLHWNIRAARLYHEIINLKPDILCLQEVQASHIESFYSKFEKIGYFGIFKQKTGQRQDGCAIYFKQSLFQLDDHVSSAYLEPAWVPRLLAAATDFNIKIYADEVASNSNSTYDKVEFYQPELPILNRDNIGVMVKLTPRNRRGPPIIVATTHLLYNPKRADVRLAQMQVFLAEIDRFAYDVNWREFGHLPIILTGDFNCTPESAVVQLLDRGYVSVGTLRDNSDWERIGVTDNCQHLAVYLNRRKGLNTPFHNTKIHNSDYRVEPPSGSGGESLSQFNSMFNSGELCHSLRLASVYTKYKQDGSVEASTYQDNWFTVDYLYFSSLRLLERLRLPTAGECAALRRLPNHVYGSDHLALAALFELTTCKPTY